VIKFQQVI